MTALRPGPSITRAVALVAAVGLQLFLLGLSAAHSTLPGDFFQVARTTATPVVVMVAPNNPDPRADKPQAPPWSVDGQLAVVIPPLLLVIAFACAAVAAAGIPTPRIRALAAVGGRGPPLGAAI